MRDLKIPRAVAMILLAGALSAAEAQDVKPTGGRSSETPVRAQVEITNLLHDFLAGAPSEKPEVYERFFADDVIYTRSAGVTIHKKDIMDSLGKEKPKPEDPKVTYDSDDITIRQYGDTAVCNFRLIMRAETDGKTATNYFRNTGTFVKRDGRWQVVAWQATKVPAEKNAAAK